MFGYKLSDPGTRKHLCQAEAGGANEGISARSAYRHQQDRRPHLAVCFESALEHRRVRVDPI